MLHRYYSCEHLGEKEIITPILSLLYVCASYTWVCVGAALSVLRQKRWRILAGFLPALMSLAVCMLSPVNDYFRYFLPIVSMLLPLLAASREN